ncbi:MAG: protein-disulfide reductase DsbD domain-containing protein [Paenirhodobacter sp.]|uniref:protein-disulfide reductase DsbD domain-containing protein n=1 Tax=Paenirhodobacter sp. TaxID=1965326 RepID=UPI003D0C7A5E
MIRFTCLAPLLLAAAPLAAQDAPAPLPPGLEGAELLDGWQAPDGHRVAAIRIDLDPGWKTYWRTPGDAGVPPRIDFAGSHNVAGVKVIWPAPVVFDQNGLRTVGYHDEMILPLEITPADPSAPVRLNADLDMGVCHDICVPVQLELDADLDGPGAPDAEIRAAMAAEPAPRPGAAHCALEPIADGMRVTATIDMPPAADEVALFELRSTPMWVSDSESYREGGQMIASAEFVPESGKPFALDPGDLRITVLSAAGAVQIDGCPQAE